MAHAIALETKQDKNLSPTEVGKLNLSKPKNLSDQIMKINELKQVVEKRKLGVKSNNLFKQERDAAFQIQDEA